jgi:Zn-dependent peptidase ImmA (M78 family)/DNA-binding XRE family transcriptional regulator
MINYFNPSRLKFARLRRKFTYKSLAEKIGMTSKMLSLYEKEDGVHVPSKESLTLIATALQYPENFFYGNDVESIESSTVSFRSLKSLKAADQNAAVSAASIGYELANYFAERFKLPEPSLPDLSGSEPETAAEIIRDLWGLGNKSIRNMIHLLESKGVRVFSLSENTLGVDAYSFWKDNVPYIFLNNQKSAERSRFDAAHELAHLVLHKKKEPTGIDLENQADNFSSCFLMPKTSVFQQIPRFITLQSIIELKSKWSVSAVSLIVRLKQLQIITEWQYRSLMVEASAKGFRKNEPFPIEREKSLVIDKIFTILKEDGMKIAELAEKIGCYPVDEIAGLLFMPKLISSSGNIIHSNHQKPELKLV